MKAHRCLRVALLSGIGLIGAACGVSKEVGPTGSAGSSGGGGTGGAGGQRPAGEACAAATANLDLGALDDTASALPPFSFFVTSLQAMRDLSGRPQGFGGDLRCGEIGEGAGLRGADKICTAIAERSLTGSAAKSWSAFLSATAGGTDNGPVHAIDRVGGGPWYDRMGRLVAANPIDLVQERPRGADATIANDLPNENGIANHTDGAPGCTGSTCPDNHDVLTGTGPDGKLYMNDPQYTCDDWTSAETQDRAWLGHSWPRTGSGTNWMSAQAAAGCAPGVNLIESGGPMGPLFTVGTSGGYGAIYCFALVP